MKRWLINLVAAVSLLLCVVFITAWTRSYWIVDSISYVRVRFDADAYRGQIWGLHSSMGGMRLIDSRSLLPDIVYFAAQRAALRQVAGWNWGRSRLRVYPYMHLPLGLSPPTLAYRMGFERTTDSQLGVSPAQPSLVYDTYTFPY